MAIIVTNLEEIKRIKHMKLKEAEDFNRELRAYMKEHNLSFKDML